MRVVVANGRGMRVKGRGYDVRRAAEARAVAAASVPRTMTRRRRMTIFSGEPAQSSSALLLLEPVLEEHEDGPLGAVDLLVLHHADHGVRVHRLAVEELEVLKPPQQVLHGRADVLLEVLDLAG